MAFKGSEKVKIYLLNIEYYYDNIEENDYETEVYSSLERAVKEGQYFLTKRCKDEGFRDFTFSITETDPIYAEQFDIEKLGLDRFHKEEFGKYEPTHIIYIYNMDGTLQSKYLKYMDKQRKYCTSFTVFPEDESALQMAGKKFKIGDIVRIKERNQEEYYNEAYMEYWTADKLYVIRYLPRKKEGQKYFENTYALISIYNENKYMKGLFTSEHYERDIEKVDTPIDEESPIRILQKIIKNEIAVSYETWTELKIGKLPLNKVKSNMNKNLYERKD